MPEKWDLTRDIQFLSTFPSVSMFTFLRKAHEISTAAVRRCGRLMKNSMMTMMTTTSTTTARMTKTKTTTNSSPKAASGQRCPCPAWVVSDLGWEGAGQCPQRGRSPVEHRGNLSVHLSVHPSFSPPPRSILRATLIFPLFDFCWRTDRRTNGRTNGLKDGRSLL